MVKAIIFDVGGVLLRTEDWSYRRSWEERLGLAAGQSDELVFNSEMGIKAQLGDVTYRQLWQWIGHFLELEDELLLTFHDGFWAGDVLDNSLVALIRHLKAKYLTGIISNYHNELRGLLHDTYRIADAFDLIVCSAEEHVMKPNPVIFERALHRLGVRAEEAVFIDDSKPNIDAAEKLGIKTIHFNPQIDLRTEFVAAGVNLRNGK